MLNLTYYNIFKKISQYFYKKNQEKNKKNQTFFYGYALCIEKSLKNFSNWGIIVKVTYEKRKKAVGL